MSRVNTRNKWMNTPKGDERCNCSKVTVYRVPIGTPNKDIDKYITRDCRKCVYELNCHDNPIGCKKYKRDAPDGGYYG